MRRPPPVDPSPSPTPAEVGQRGHHQSPVQEPDAPEGGHVVDGAVYDKHGVLIKPAETGRPATGEGSSSSADEWGDVVSAETPTPKRTVPPKRVSDDPTTWSHLCSQHQQGSKPRVKRWMMM